MVMNNFCRRIINALIASVKKQEYAIDSEIYFFDLLELCLDRLSMALRSLCSGFFYKKIHRPLFQGVNSKIKHRSHVFFGTGCTIHSNVQIEGLSKRGVFFGDNVNIPDHTYIRCTGVISDLGVGLKVGSNTGFGHYNFINAQGGIEIGSNVIIGPHVMMLSENHLFRDATTPIRLQGVTRKGIFIKDNVWIGAGAIILDGVIIHSGSVIAAGAVVNKDVPANTVWGGIPARQIATTSNLG